MNFRCFSLASWEFYKWLEFWWENSVWTWTVVVIRVMKSFIVLMLYIGYHWTRVLTSQALTFSVRMILTQLYRGQLYFDHFKLQSWYIPVPCQLSSINWHFKYSMQSGWHFYQFCSQRGCFMWLIYKFQDYVNFLIKDLGFHLQQHKNSPLGDVTDTQFGEE